MRDLNHPDGWKQCTTLDVKMTVWDLTTQDFLLIDINKDVKLPEFWNFCFTPESSPMLVACQHSSKGTMNRKRFKIELFLEEILPLPSIPEQKVIVVYNNELYKLAQLS